MKTTLNEIKKYSPCNQHGDAKEGGWNGLLAALNKDKADDEPLSLMTILKHNGIGDATWALRCFDLKEYGLFNADVAESVLHIFEEEYPEDLRPRLGIKAIRDYCNGKLDKKALESAYIPTYAYTASAYTASAIAAMAASAASAASADERENKWQEIEQIFIKHFGEGLDDEY